LTTSGWTRLLGAYAALRVALLAWSSWSVRFVMDEMALLQQFVYFDKLYEGVDPIKTVLAIYFFNSPRLLFEDSVSLLLAGRALGFGVACGMAVAVALAARRLGGSWLGGLLGVATLLTFTNFAERAYRLRTDDAQALLAAIAVAAVLASRSLSAGAWRAGLATGTAFLCTQKAIYVAIAFGVGFLICEGWKAGAWRRALANAARFSTGWAVVLLAYALAFGGRRFVSVLEAILVGPSRFAVQTLHDYSGLERYRVLSLRQNFLLYLLAAAALVWVVRNWKAQPAATRVAAVATIVVAPLSFFHYQPWPYVFVLPQVFVAPWVAALLQPALGLTRTRRHILGWTCAAAFLLSLPRAFVYPAVHINDEQLQAVRWLEQQVRPDEKYFDGLGMLPTRVQAGGAYNWWWDRPALLQLARDLRAGDRRTIDEILRDQPKIWILNYRTMSVMPMLSPILRESFVRVSPMTLSSGVEFAAGQLERKFFCVWPGPYRLFGRDGRSLEQSVSIASGYPVAKVDLPFGWITVTRSSPESSAVLLPADTVLEAPLPAAEQPVPDLFQGVYNF
jgi:hypothetical protein